MKWVKIIGILLLCFIILMIATGQGKAAAHIVMGLWDGLVSFIKNFGVFISNLG